MNDRHRFHLTLTTLCLAALYSALLVGCGGGGGGGGPVATTGGLQVAFTWPSRAARLVPAAANSIVVTIHVGPEEIARQVLPRPAGNQSSVSTATFNDLPVGQLALVAKSYASTDGTGTPLSSAAVPVTIEGGKVTTVNVNMTSTIAFLELNPVSSVVEVGSTLPLLVAAKDAANAVVMLTPAKLTWSSGNTGVATVDANGVVTGVGGGTTQITVTDTESGKSATVSVRVPSAGGAPASVLYVADRGNHRVVRMNDANGSGWATLTGQPFNAVGKFTLPRGVWLDAQNRIYVADAAGNRIVRMDDISGSGWTMLVPEGTALSPLSNPKHLVVDAQGWVYWTAPASSGVGRAKMGPTGSTTVLPFNRGLLQSFNNPTGVALDNTGHLIVSETGGDTITRINASVFDGVPLARETFPSDASHNFLRPEGVAVDSQNRIYVADYGHDRVVRMDDFTGAGWTTYSVTTPSGVSVDATGHIFITSRTTHQVIRLDDMSGAGAVSLGTLGDAPGQFNLPSSVAVGTDGRIVVADAGNHRVALFANMSGAGWGEIGLYGVQPGDFLLPTDVALDSQGRVYVVDAGANRVMRFNDISGSGWTVFGGLGTGTNKLQAPEGIWVDSSDRIYIADRGNNRVVRINDMSGAGWAAYSTYALNGNPFQPNDVASDSKGRIYFAGAIGVARIDDMTGAGLVVMDRFRPSNSQLIYDLDNAYGLFIDPIDRIYVGAHNFVRLDDFVSGANAVQGPARDFEGRVYVDGRQRIYSAAFTHITVVDDITGAGLTTFGTQGSGVGQFEDARGIAGR